MRLHTNLISNRNVYDALNAAQKAGQVAQSVHFHIFEDKGSRTRDHAFEIQLGCWDKIKGDKRGWKNSGGYGAAGIYAATYAEWGFFIAALYEIDSDMVFGTYKGVEDFHTQTGYMFASTIPQPDPAPYILTGRTPRRFATQSPYGSFTHAPRNAEGVAA